VQGDYLLPALSRLGIEDQQFALAFILRSGSLKEMAKLYGVSYPTVRNRLDDVIARLSAIIESPETDAAGETVRAGTDATVNAADAARQVDDAAGARAHGGGGHTDAAGSDE
jgi:hypothetical protein